ncbi:MAG TPA: mechanosensitive ion channel family protein [Blastocatellia bacterium]|nr:mechanosensitive ion channel family protein [Blastocatellia bacterium]
MKKLIIPLALSAVLAFVYGVAVLPEPDLFSEEAKKWLLTASLLSLGIFLVRAIGFVLFDVLFQRRKGREAPALLRGVVSIIGYLILLIAAYWIVLEKNLGNILATSAVVSVIIGLALQDTLGNFFAGVSLHIEQPYHIKDAIRVDKMIGRVESVTWRATTIRTNDNTIIIIPNSKVAREPLEVFPFGNLNRRILRFPAPYRIPPQTVICLVREAVRAVPNVATEITPVVRINEFADSSITYEVLYWVKDYMWTPDMDAKIRERIWYVYNRSDIEIPFPVRTIIMGEQELSTSREADYHRALDQVHIFDPLSEQEKEAVVKSMVRSVYAPGEIIIRRGDPGESMFIIHRGKVEVRLPSNNGDQHHVAVLEPGNFFGEMALLTGEPRTADVSAIEEVEILEIRKGVIEQLLGDNAQLAEELSRKIADRQAELAQLTRAVAEDEKRMQTQTILRRIKGFFRMG